MKLGSKISYENKRKWYGFTFILPWLIGCILFFLSPLFTSFRYAFQSLEASPTGFVATNVGWDNFSSLFFKDTTFLPDLVGSLTDLIQVPLILVYSLFFAILIKGKFPGRTFMRAVAFMPVIIGSGVLMQILKEDVFASGARGGSADTYLFAAGNIPAMLTSMGMGTGVVNFVNQVISRVFDLTWRSGVQIMLFLAGLHGIPDYLYEASSLEGAGGFAQFWKVTLPMLTPMILLNTIYSVIDMMNDYGNTIIRSINNTMFSLFKFGYASAMSVVYFLVIIIILALVALLLRRFIIYQD